jgi:hypothetical protein
VNGLRVRSLKEAVVLIFKLVHASNAGTDDHAAAKGVFLEVDPQ